MTIVNFNPQKMSFDKETKTFTVSERDVAFATTYTIINPKTGNGQIFHFVESTGPEFDPLTEWLYASFEGCVLRVVNDAKITKERASRYAIGKMNH